MNMLSYGFRIICLEYRMQAIEINEESAITIYKVENLPTHQNKDCIKRISNGYRSSKYFKRFVTIERLFLISLIIQILLTVCYYESSIKGETLFTTIVLYILLVHSATAVFINFLKRECFNDWKSSELKEYQGISRPKVILDSIILLLQPYPFTQSISLSNWDYIQEAMLDFKLNYVFIILSYFKLGLLFQSILNISKFKKPRASRVCTIYGCQSSILYAVKCYFIESPVKMIVFILFSAMFIFAFAFRVSEHNEFSFDNRLNLFENSIWLVLMTMTSVGFGDLSPRTQWGRMIGFICTFCGVLIVSVMILVVTNTFQLSTGQNNSLSLLNRVQNKRKLKQKAAMIIRVSMWRLWKNYKRRKENDYVPLDLKNKMERVNRIAFFQALRQSKFQDDREINIGEDMDRQFQKVNDHLERLDDNFDNMINHLGQKYFLNIEEIMNEGYAMDKFGVKNSMQQSFRISSCL